MQGCISSRVELNTKTCQAQRKGEVACLCDSDNCNSDSFAIPNDAIIATKPIIKCHIDSTISDDFCFGQQCFWGASGDISAFFKKNLRMWYVDVVSNGAEILKQNGKESLDTNTRYLCNENLSVFVTLGKRRQDDAPIEVEERANYSRDGISGFLIDSSKRACRSNDENVKPGELAVARVDSFVDPIPDYDFDKEEAHNPDSVSEFAQDIFRYYKSREVNFRVVDYLKRHPEIDIKVRAILIDWLVELQESFELNHETLYNSVKLVDIYLSKTSNVSRDTIQMMACAAIFIAAKFDERSPPLADDLIYLAGDRFDRDSLMAMERKLFKIVDFDLGAPLSYRYLRRLGRVMRIDMATLTLSRYLLETSLLVYDYSLVSASRIASAAFLLAMKMKDRSFKWNSILIKYSGYMEDEVVPLMEHLNHMIHFVNTQWEQLVNIREKYSHEVFFKAALVPLIPDTYPSTSEIPPLPQMSFP
ncbi:unnamed protein product [Caenorhabditis bovis]|uniref:G2/mitotic-specific cyclin-B3 n=1 Tax=Caenorhabditis bovis TaxID=2654633 RepID=A0A8S1EB02_9PELO|nr:unnamed protein product [Caenorhabditis bovis]